MTVQLLGHARGRSPQAQPLRCPGAPPGGSYSRLAPPVASGPSPIPVYPSEEANREGCPAPLLSGSFPFSGSLHPDPVSLSIAPGTDPSASRPPHLRLRRGDGDAASSGPGAATPALGAVRRQPPRGVSRATGRSGRAGQGGFRSGFPRRPPPAAGKLAAWVQHIGGSPVSQLLTAECERDSSFSSQNPF